MQENLPAVQQSRYLGIAPRGIDEMIRLAKIMAASGLMPKGIQTPEAVFVVLQMGSEVGLSPMASVQNTSVIHGRPGLFGDVALAVVRASGELEVFEEWSEGKRKSPEWTFFCKIKRRGTKEAIGSYSWAEACEAGMDKADSLSPWKRWTNRMMQFKARNFIMRDHFTDCLKGIRTVEENNDSIDLESTTGSDGREQYQAPAKGHPDSEMSGSGSLDENAFESLAAEQYPDGQEKLIEFVDLTAKANNASIEALKSRAVGNWSEFIKAFEAWLSKQTTKTEPANEKEIPATPETTTPEPAPKTVDKPADNGCQQALPSDAAVWNDFRTRFINLKAAGFSTFVYQNLELFKNCPRSLQMEAIEKWSKLYPTSCPFASTQAPASKTPASEKTESAMSLSYTPQYKNLMARKTEFPTEYAEAKKELGIPITAEGCEKLLCRMMELVEVNVDGQKDEYQPPSVSDTSGF